MNELFYHGYCRLSSLLGEITDTTVRAKMSEALRCIEEAERSKNAQYEQLEKDYERLQNRYNKLKEQKQ